MTGRPAAVLSSILLLLAACGADSVPARASEEDAEVEVDGNIPDLDPGDFVPGFEEQVAFEGYELTLEGTLTVPDHYSNIPVPGVVLIHGSGPVGRDALAPPQALVSFGIEIAIFRDLATELSARGYAVLRYDKRTCTTSTGCVNDYPPATQGLVIEHFLADADSAIEFMANRFEVDPNLVVPVGHSQGARFVPDLMDVRPELPGGVLLAGAYRPIDELFAFQADSRRELMTELGYSEAEIDGALAALETALVQLAELRAGEFQGMTILGASVEFWISWFELCDRALELAPSLSAPLLVLSGGYDLNVPPEETQAWATLLGTNDVIDHKTDVLPCITHSLVCVTEPQIGLVEEDDVGTTVDAQVIDELVIFLDSVTAS